MIDVKAIMDGTLELDKITFDDMVADAEERENEDAIVWLDEQQKIEKTRTRNKGKENEYTYTIQKPISEIRAEYLAKYTDYETKSKQTARAKSVKKRGERINRNTAIAQEALERIRAKKKK